jgi:hypothetical protein
MFYIICRVTVARSKILFTIFSLPNTSVADPGCFRYVFPGSDFFPSRILDPGSALKNLRILTPKNCFWALGNMIRVVHPGSGSRIRILTFYPSWSQGSKRHRKPDPGPGSATLPTTKRRYSLCYSYISNFSGDRQSACTARICVQ